MIASILNKAYGCSYFVGDGSGYGDKNSDLFVLESCEYNKHFLAYFPDNAVITNIELDHTETYHNIENMIDTYQIFLNKTEKNIVAYGDDLNIRKLKLDKKVYYYGFNNNNDLVVKNREIRNHKTCFDVYYHEKYFDHYELPIFGDHMVNDTLATIMICILYNVDKDIIRDELDHYKPATRRFNEKVVGRNVVVDDYAHHPTEIRVTYDSAHLKYPNKKVIAIFLPNTYSRTEALFNDFVDALNIFDKAYVMDIKCDRERKEDYQGVSSQKLVASLKNGEMIDLDSITKLMDYDNTVLCFMSCASISKMINKYIEIKKKG